MTRALKGTNKLGFVDKIFLNLVRMKLRFVNGNVLMLWYVLGFLALFFSLYMLIMLVMTLLLIFVLN